MITELQIPRKDEIAIDFLPVHEIQKGTIAPYFDKVSHTEQIKEQESKGHSMHVTVLGISFVLDGTELTPRIMAFRDVDHLSIVSPQIIVEPGQDPEEVLVNAFMTQLRIKTTTKPRVVSLLGQFYRLKSDPIGAVRLGNGLDSKIPPTEKFLVYLVELPSKIRITLPRSMKPCLIDFEAIFEARTKNTNEFCNIWKWLPELCSCLDFVQICSK